MKYLMSCTATFPINANQITFLGMLSSFAGSVRYATLRKAISKEKRTWGMQLPKTVSMCYKRVFEMKQKNYLVTKQAPIFPSFAIITLTTKGVTLLKGVTTFVKFLVTYNVTSQAEKFAQLPLCPEKKEKSKQLTMDLFRKIDRGKN